MSDFPDAAGARAFESSFSRRDFSCDMIRLEVMMARMVRGSRQPRSFSGGLITRLLRDCPPRAEWR